MVDDYAAVTSSINSEAAKYGVLAPASGHESVSSTTSVVTLNHTSRALWIGTGGTLVCNLSGSTANPATFTNVADGTLLPLRVTGFTTANTASGIVSLY